MCFVHTLNYLCRNEENANQKVVAFAFFRNFQNKNLSRCAWHGFRGIDMLDGTPILDIKPYIELTFP
jgi:hypothetical protein